MGDMGMETGRLRLRGWTDADVEPFIAMGTDPEVMRYVTPTVPTPAYAKAAAVHYRQQLETKGYGWWVLEATDAPGFAGIILLQDVEFEAAFTPAIEVGWLLPREQWGKGYATEGARIALDHAFGPMKLDEVVSLTTAGNMASQRVMQRLGMTHDPADDFEHPQLPTDPMRFCVLYRMKRT
jgi:RimJ/RimL family protein N-acetyltransferase